MSIIPVQGYNDFPYTPQKACEYRQRIADNLRTYPDAHGKLWHPPFSGAAVRHIADWLGRAEIVLWEEALLSASQSGAETAFRDKPWDLGWPDGRFQFWLLTTPSQVGASFPPNHALARETNCQWGYVGTLIGKLDGEYRLLQAFNPAYEKGKRPKAETIEEIFQYEMKHWVVAGSIRENEPAGDMALILAANHFMNSTIACAEPHIPSRQVRRHAERRGIELPFVTTVRLRRREGATLRETAGNSNYNYQWIVAGHWRNQWYPKTEEHKPVFINPYRKGPENKPLLPPRESVYAVVR